MTRWATAAQIASFALVAAAAMLLALHAPRPAAAEPAGCGVYGQVLDRYSQPVAGIHLRLARGAELLNTVTDEQGRYRFEAGSITGRTADAFNVPLSVELLSRESARSPGRFQIMYRQRLASLRSDTFTAASSDCERDFRFAALPSNYRSTGPSLDEWPAVIELYQNFQSGWLLAEQLGIDFGPAQPFLIYAWCDDASYGCAVGDGDEPGDFAGMIATGSSNSITIDRPWLVFGEATSEIASGGRPDNREYHEMGHLVQYALFDWVLPVYPTNVNHGGYYRNETTTDSWVEGFAEFFSVMVSKHIAGEATPERYRISGAEYDIELDHRAWEWAGWWEELSLAGLLLDFEDGDDDYALRGPDPSLGIEDARVIDVTGGRMVTGSVVNFSSTTRIGIEVAVELFDASGASVHLTVAPVFDHDLAAGETTTFAVPLPAGLAFDRLTVTAGPLPGVDDDPIDVELAELIAVIAAYESDHPSGSGRLFDVAELWEALSIAFGGVDADGDGVDDVDQIFEAHGFFADADGNQSRGPAERVGLTSHPALGEFPARPTRRDLPPSEAATIEIDTGGVATQVMVTTTFAPPNEHRSSGYIVDVGPDGRVQIAAPPREFEAELTVTVFAEGRTPSIVLRISNSELWERFDRQLPGETLGTITAELEVGELDAGPLPAASSGGGPTSGGPTLAAGGRSLPGGGLVWLIAVLGLLAALGVFAESRLRRPAAGRQ